MNFCLYVTCTFDQMNLFVVITADCWFGKGEGKWRRRGGEAPKTDSFGHYVAGTKVVWGDDLPMMMLDWWIMSTSERGGGTPNCPETSHDGYWSKIPHTDTGLDMLHSSLFGFLYFQRCDVSCCPLMRSYYIPSEAAVLQPHSTTFSMVVDYAQSSDQCCVMFRLTFSITIHVSYFRI